MKTLLLLTSLATAAIPLPVHAQHEHGAGAAPAPAASASAGRSGGRPAARDWTRQPLLAGRPVKEDRDAAVITARSLAATRAAVRSFMRTAPWPARCIVTTRATAPRPAP